VSAWCPEVAFTCQNNVPFVGPEYIMEKTRVWSQANARAMRSLIAFVASSSGSLLVVPVRGAGFMGRRQDAPAAPPTRVDRRFSMLRTFSRC
jgi:hypothetical protein